jgi:hypothetical protein
VYLVSIRETLAYRALNYGVRRLWVLFLVLLWKYTEDSSQSHITPLVACSCRDLPRPSRLRHNTDVTRHGLAARTHHLHHTGAACAYLMNHISLQAPITVIHTSTT